VRSVAFCVFSRCPMVCLRFACRPDCTPSMRTGGSERFAHQLALV
jgi:hypothetical protein